MCRIIYHLGKTRDNFHLPVPILTVKWKKNNVAISPIQVEVTATKENSVNCKYEILNLYKHSGPAYSKSTYN